MQEQAGVDGGHWDVIVIGSGFGGSIVANRLSAAGQRVLVLERGRHYRPGDFPRDLKQVNEVFWRYPDKPASRGLYDVRFFSGIAAVAASGVGGGSLVYANIHYRPQAVIFDDPRWPACFNRDSLEPYYQRVADKLGVSPLPADINVRKRELFVQAAQRLNRPCFDVPQAVSWSEPLDGKAGRKACQLLAECEFGCNQGAKNTLDFNYLSEAIENGARLQAETQVSHIAPAQQGWTVHYRDTRTEQNGKVTGTRVVLAAGTLGTGELLLRSRDVTRTLPDLPARLGFGYSGNGDFLGNIQNMTEDFDPTHGPDVTSAIWFFDQRPGFALAAPTFNKPTMAVLASLGQRPVYPLVKLVAPLLYRSLGRLLPWVCAKGWLNQPLSPPGPNAGSPERMTNLFAIGEDNAGGRLYLKRGRLDIAWDYERENAQLLARQEQAMHKIAAELGGRYANLDSWNLFRRILTVHNLGGCAIAESEQQGVVSTDGEIFRHPGLYVADGSIIPTSIGSHPAMTISALAEWIAERMLNPQAAD